jgi:hypothetical protein
VIFVLYKNYFRKRSAREVFSFGALRCHHSLHFREGLIEEVRVRGGRAHGHGRRGDLLHPGAAGRLHRPHHRSRPDDG